MKLFTCTHCGNVLYFENVRCEKCGYSLGFVPEDAVLLPLAEQDGVLAPVDADGQVATAWAPRRRCHNATYDACNWLVRADDPAEFCLCCRHNRKVPDLSNPACLSAWQRVEQAKHRLFYTLLRLGLPRDVQDGSDGDVLTFDILPDPEDGALKVMTGHENGRITLALAEADDLERQRRRIAMGEPYRTLLGHMRHEVGHYYWDVLVRDGGRLDECRALFGDDRADYQAALQRHYADGPAPDWQSHVVSAYASSHPWEDFAETFGHYLHIMDTLEMGAAFGVSVRPRLPTQEAELLAAKLDFDPFKVADFTEILEAWLPVTFMANNLNRCMGETDLYPFVLSAPVVEKLGFIHRLMPR